jgi:hypothetical protein
MSEPTETNRRKSRRRDGGANTYRNKTGWHTVIPHKLKPLQPWLAESRSLVDLHKRTKPLPIYDGALDLATAKLTISEFLTKHGYRYLHHKVHKIPGSRRVVR